MKQNPPAPFWAVRGISRNTKEVAKHAAQSRNVALGEWLSEAIAYHSNSSRAAAYDAKEAAIFEQLEDLERRMIRYEKMIEATLLPRRTVTEVDLQDLLSAYVNVRTQRQ